ncbi:MAG: hypothetical protein LQ345_001628 [Seirophora villosa]|nr:MAG: hypothetical protein LQ345_001628 [Seirophora villosa]
MNVQRFTHLSARRSRLLERNHSSRNPPPSLPFAIPLQQSAHAANPSRNRGQMNFHHSPNTPLIKLPHRPAATGSIPPSYKVPLHDGNAILNRQRLNRPVSPHLTIYQTQIPWTLSALNRITGSVLSGGFYVFGFAYLVSPLLGWHIESAALAQSFAELPTLVKGGLKFLVALPFTFHSFNGVRHLIWDSGREFANKSVVRTGWVVMGLTVVSSLGLAVYGT